MNIVKAILAATALAATVICAQTTAFAIPMADNYTLSSSFINGTFTSNSSSLSSYDFTVTAPGVPINWTGPTAPSPTLNTPLQNDMFFFRHTTTDTNGAIYTFFINWPSTITNNVLNTGIFRVTPERVIWFADNPSFAIAAVPEPSSVLLFASGLLGLAGYRWQQRRREGTQLG